MNADAARPQSADEHLRQGIGLLQQGRWAEALTVLEAGLELDAGQALVHLGRGTALLELGRPEEALAGYDRAIDLAPGRADSWMARGRALKELGQREAALRSYDRAIALDANYAEAHCNRASVLHDLDRWEESLESYDRALGIRPQLLQAHANRGVLLQGLQRVDAALAACDAALAIDPSFAQARVNRAMALLLGGDLERGWAEFEWRWRTGASRQPPFERLGARPWNGEPLAGRTLLLYPEGGLGDTLQFCRYAPLLAAQGARVILAVQGPLETLLAGLAGPALVVGPQDALPGFEYFCSLLSLPRLLGTTLATVPAQVPYVRAPGARLQQWRARLGPRARPRVGLVWSGGFRAPQLGLWAANRRRNIPLAALAPLNRPDIEFYSLQKGQSARAELAEASAQNWPGPPLIDLTPQLRDFADTAALIEQLDLVISVDTSTAHLAGALGKPVWILNRYDTCWRWLLDRSDSPWYPTARLYRQGSPGDWAGVVARVRADLGSVSLL
ncbi:MAG TPA: tetratricopeptide repeat-containing glycosyltransferase family protein [Steroidobacteraceae bacterium]|nr:tetratricopeptide repeat-containing glycosyltransferase family protein [Steroidobacteraceae bacterium]